MIKKLNLGCGPFKKKGYVNLDYDATFKPDIKHNLDKFPYPFRDNEFELIEGYHVLEHLNDTFRVMKELHRISKDGGLIIIRVPHFSRGFAHPEHKCGFDVCFSYFFNPAHKEFYKGFEMELKSFRFSWLGQPYLKIRYNSRPVYYLSYFGGVIIDFFANLFPKFCSKCWCFWVGGFSEMEFQFIVRKKGRILGT